jgi:hypothetical protein
MYERFEQIAKIQHALQNANNALSQYSITNGASSFDHAQIDLQSALSHEIGVESKFTKYINFD